MSIATVRTHHTPSVRTSALAALTVAAALAAGSVLTDALSTNRSPGAPARLPADVPAAPEWRIGSPDALERSLAGRNDTYAGDPRAYGSPDAAERILGR